MKAKWLDVQRRSIPAWAGETHRRYADLDKFQVYPRVGGGNSHAPYPPPSLTGLSPRGRGKRGKVKGGKASWRSIPAWAGETATIALTDTTTGVYPRVGGGNSHQFIMRPLMSGLSPRGRGKPDSR